MKASLLTLQVKYEHDVVLARQRARQVAGLLGFEAQDQVRIATAVSEIVRNAFQYAGGGRVEFTLERETAELVVGVRDHGPGIADLQAVLDGRYASSTGMGLGILGARRLMDRFEICSTANEGTSVRMLKALPSERRDLVKLELARLAEELARQAPQNPFEEIQRQNQELLRALEELRLRQEELARLNQELEETNRGVVALYTELDEKAGYLQRTSEMKSRFLSNLSHELKTPLNAIRTLSRMLMDRMDGELTEEQEKQVALIRKSAEDLSELVNDMLDLARIEAGKIVVRPSEFEVADLFSALRGMFRPLSTAAEVALRIEEPNPGLTMRTDEGKVAQILRNFISNALKFTECGEIRVTAEPDAGGRVVFSVMDTGIGIAPEHQERIFEEFSQVEGPHQMKHGGTGLGLPLSRRLVELLGGTLSVESVPGRGSTFRAVIPRLYPGGERSETALKPPAPQGDAR